MELACDLTGTCVAGDVVTVTGIVKVATQDNGTMLLSLTITLIDAKIEVVIIYSY